MRSLRWYLLCIASLLTEVALAAKKVEEPVVKSLATIGDSQLVAGFLSSKEEQTFVVMVALWIIREAWAFFREKANKTGEKVTEMNNKITEMSTKLDAFIRASEKQEDRMDARIRRLEDKRVEK